MAKKKTLLIIPVMILIAIIATMVSPMSVLADDSSYEPRLTAPSSSNPYYNSQLNYYSQTGTGMPNCVAYAYGRIYEMNGEAPLLTHGNAGEWYSMNKAGGYYDYGSEPKLGAVACWSNHVAVVEQINDDGSVTFSESHWGGTYFDTVTYSDVTSHYGQKFYGYIYTYNEGVSKELENKLLTATNEKTNQYKTEANDVNELGSDLELVKVNLTSEKVSTKKVASPLPLLQNKLNS